MMMSGAIGRVQDVGGSTPRLRQRRSWGVWLGVVSACALAAGVVVAPGPAMPASAAPSLRETLTAHRIDLGTLGGRDSDAVAVDGDVVVGESRIRNRTVHAFAYDLRAPIRGMRDLGTLPGDTDSSATAVSGNLVVGTSAKGSTGREFVYDLDATPPRMRYLPTLGGESNVAQSVSGTIVVGGSYTAAGVWHAFAYDVAAAKARIRDLGTLGGDYSDATKVDHNIVVGTSTTTNGAEHAFAFDLGASHPVMRDLGALLKGGSSDVADVSGTVIAGRSNSDRSERAHGFVYDLAAAKPRMKDLGGLSGGNGESEPAAVDGTTVVGTANAGSCEHPFAYSLDSPDLGMRDLGTLGGCENGASDVSSNVVVGIADRAGDGQSRLVAYDLGAASAALTDLGPLSPFRWPSISGDTVVGAMVAGKSEHAAAWTLSRTTKPGVEFDRLNTSIPENAGRVSVAVTRAGDPGPAITVRYTTKGITARAGEDFTGASGTLSFAAGQTTDTFTVPIRNDPVTEGPETLMVVLGSPTGGAIRGTPNVAGVTIRASDQRPDALISTRATRGYVGHRIYNSTGAGQTRKRTVQRGRSRSFYVQIDNSGDVTNTITLHASPPPAAAVVRYHRGSSDLTAAMGTQAGLPFRMGPHSHRRIKMTIEATVEAHVGLTLPASINATWTGDRTLTDLVRGVVKVVR
jgi:probable HAF family extracellular repeat protein